MMEDYERWLSVLRGIDGTVWSLLHWMGRLICRSPALVLVCVCYRGRNMHVPKGLWWSLDSERLGCWRWSPGGDLGFCHEDWQWWWLGALGWWWISRGGFVLGLFV
ncbi:hypothetical protein RchiOBHm_Chr3g0458861 [Rosa chinensis]|uniref:Uncharacterized protein n=1 Tax=Rosa chinensis TaxID=74649 RepID=A0A2P6R7Z6_ROSCH|nr:hypothetical protein RchiOBHm_Chr3g0458861 [Rosa chinensis]